MICGVTTNPSLIAKEGRDYKTVLKEIAEIVDGEAVYKTTPAVFAEAAARAVKMGVRCVGGCCGTTPAHIAALAKAVRESA